MNNKNKNYKSIIIEESDIKIDVNHKFYLFI